MPLVRAWMRGLSGASGAALLVPGAIIAALLLLGLAGSFGRLGGLGQALSGPAAPRSAPPQSTARGSRGGAPALLAVVSAPTAAVVATRAVTRNPAAPAGGRTSSSPPSSPPARNGGGGGGGGSSTAPPGPGSPGGTGGCSTCGQPPPPTHQTLVDQVVNIGTSITSKLPGPVGQLTTQLLKQVGSTVDKILPTDTRSGAVSQLGSALSQLKLP